MVTAKAAAVIRSTATRPWPEPNTTFCSGSSSVTDLTLVLVSRAAAFPNELQAGPHRNQTMFLWLEEPAGGDRAGHRLIEAAQQVCPYSNATRGNIPVELVIE
jgi:hypothetical protein